MVHRRLGARTIALDAPAQLLPTSRTPARIIGPNFSIDAHHQYRFAFGDLLLCFPLQEHERLWKVDVKNDIDIYVGDKDSVKGGSVIYMPFTHNFLTSGNGHRILISDIQLLQWYSQRRNIRRNPLPYSVVKDAVMDLLAHNEIPVTRTGATQLLITQSLTEAGTHIDSTTSAVIQHAIPYTAEPVSTKSSPRPRTALIPSPASIRQDKRTRAKTIFYK